MAPHRLTPDTLTALAGGSGGVAAIRQLRDVQVSKHLLLVRAVLVGCPARRGELDEAAEMLVAAETRDPHRTREVLGHPLVGAWATAAAREFADGNFGAQHVDHVRALAVVAAAGAGLDAGLAVSPRGGVVALPTVGVAQVADDHRRVRLRAARGEITVSSASGWSRVHRLTTSVLDQVAVDDVDPYRHGHHAPPAPRLGAADVQRWRFRLTAAEELMAKHLPIRAAEVGAGLRAMVPLQETTPGAARSATLRHVFGAFGLTEPKSPSDLVVTIVHEFQHSKLGAVLDVEPLYDGTDDGLYCAPWRTDPRPLSGLMQGVYAFLGVADAWRSLRDDTATAAVAEREFAVVRLQVDRGLAALETAPTLTPAGRAFIGGMRSTLDKMLSEPVPPDARRSAELAMRRGRG